MPYSLCLWLIVVSGPAWSWAWIGNRAWGDLFVSPQEPSNERPVDLGSGLPAGRDRRPLLQHGVSMVAHPRQLWRTLAEMILETNLAQKIGGSCIALLPPHP